MPSQQAPPWSCALCEHADLTSADHRCRPQVLDAPPKAIRAPSAEAAAMVLELPPPFRCSAAMSAAEASATAGFSSNDLESQSLTAAASGHSGDQQLASAARGEHVLQTGGVVGQDDVQLLEPSVRQAIAVGS